MDVQTDIEIFFGLCELLIDLSQNQLDDFFIISWHRFLFLADSSATTFSLTCDTYFILILSGAFDIISGKKCNYINYFFCLDENAFFFLKIFHCIFFLKFASLSHMSPVIRNSKLFIDSNSLAGAAIVKSNKYQKCELG